ncbi:hypothetical protein Tfu_3052 [Thermobifida fusca YX]|jgi:hypothetical protein|uniref:Uncharacterized protein n=1 Tax=Thermobifida fusca (strain YX) TaxID=269800 RepID=Q47KD7_THEFY|nr:MULTISPECIES: hypothetical protein [Thermobifida]AAZ57085.1 hypothetical protein Tfu_3052 [Thermobifida fusca YX]MBO2530134.1 hypothetical protein [Thermobifida sp.]PPS95012.1 hypothetical protein BH05_04495 [Thermobifida fusca]PZN65852.1 MAG: hypothetical protein DIU53_03080 [Thermobifida fusca]
MAESTVRIFDIMACNVYWDFDGSPLPREQHKFLVSFYPTKGAPTPELIDSIVAYGPDGYRVEFANQRFTPDNKNGYIYDRTLDYYWYMVNLATGFLPEGEYTIEVTGKDGTVDRRSRMQRQESTDALVPAYREHRQQILNSFAPSGRQRLPEGTALTDLVCSWRTLKELAGRDAYYIYRLAEGGSAREFDTQNLTWWDNIFFQKLRGDATAGLNRDSVTVAAELKPDTTYAYFVEITDSNVQSETNICIFQPHQVFTTP